MKAKPRLKENTVAAVAAALKDYDGCEFDVRLTKDGVPVLHHNSEYKGRRIWELDRKALPAVEGLSDLLGDERVKKAVNDDGKTLWIEVKEGSNKGLFRDDAYLQETAEAVRTALRESGLEPNNIRLISFQPRLLRCIKGFKRLPIVPFTYGAFDPGILHRTPRTYVEMLTPISVHIENAKERGFGGLLFSNRYLRGPFSAFQPKMEEIIALARKKFILGTEARTREEELAFRDLVVITDHRGKRTGKGPKDLICHRGL